MDPFPLLVVAIAVVAFSLLAPLFTSNRRAKIEHNQRPLWEEKCSGRMGAIGVGIPAIRVSLYRNFMVVAFLGTTVIPYSDIQSVSVKRGFSILGTTGIGIKMRNMLSGYHFRSRDPNKVAELIQARL